MTLFVPHSWDWSARDRTKQTTQALAGAAALGTLGSTLFKRNMPFRGIKRQRTGTHTRFTPTGVYRSVGTQTRSMVRRKRRSSGRGFTKEHDKAFIYRKKRMPYRKKKRWVRFVKKVNAVDERELGTKSVVFNNQFEDENGAASAQGVNSFCLYGIKSSEVTKNDIKTIVDAEPTTETTRENVNNTTKFMFHSGVLDMTIRNTSGGASAEEQVAEFALELDIYEISVGGYPYDTSNLVFNNLEDYFAAGAGDTNSIGVTTAINLQDRGVTPWDVTNTLSRYRVKIWKKTKYFIPNGSTITYQVRDPKRHVLTKGGMSEYAGYNKKGLTRNVLLIYKAVPGIQVSGQNRERITVGITRKYMYKVEGSNMSESSYY